jgi:ABC-type nitrate/sulfonate/bicarbonate transport system ATPase subunit
MAEANVLLLDEPTTGLDDMNKWRFQELLRRLWCIHHFTCVLVTHDLEEAIFVSDQIAVMREGCLVELVRVPFPADRKNSLRYEPQFASMRRHLSDLLFSKEGAS